MKTALNPPLRQNSPDCCDYCRVRCDGVWVIGGTTAAPTRFCSIVCYDRSKARDQ